MRLVRYVTAGLSDIAHLFLRRGLHTCVLKQVVHDLHDATGVLNDRDIGALDHFQGAVLKAIYWLETMLSHVP
jgi:hypothetical protein